MLIACVGWKVERTADSVARGGQGSTNQRSGNARDATDAASRPPTKGGRCSKGALNWAVTVTLVFDILIVLHPLPPQMVDLEMQYAKELSDAVRRVEAMEQERAESAQIIEGHEVRSRTRLCDRQS